MFDFFKYGFRGNILTVALFSDEILLSNQYMQLCFKEIRGAPRTLWSELNIADIVNEEEIDDGESPD